MPTCSGWAGREALLLGAVVSSTDAAAVFAVLRGSGLQLKRRVGVTLEVESGINDPVAVILTTVLTQNLLTPGSASAAADPAGDRAPARRRSGWSAPRSATAGRHLLSRLASPSGGLYPVMTLALGLLAFGVATLAHGSGFLAVYLAGLLLGNGPLPYRAGLLRVHDALAWLSQVGMFLILGLLVYPSRLLDVAGSGSPSRCCSRSWCGRWWSRSACCRSAIPGKEVLYIGWVGLRGAVPIVLATFPVLAGAPGAGRLFDLVFFIVVASALVPGGDGRLGDPAARAPEPRSRRRRRRCWPSSRASRSRAS